MACQWKQEWITVGQWLLPDEQTSAMQFMEGRDSRTHFRDAPPAGVTGGFEQPIYMPAKQKHWGWCFESGVVLGEISRTFSHAHAKQGRHEWWISQRHGIWRTRKKKDSLSIDQLEIKTKKHQSLLINIRNKCKIIMLAIEIILLSCLCYLRVFLFFLRN